MRQLIETFLDSGLRVEDVFLNCTILKNVIIEMLFENGIDKLKIAKTTSIFDQNLHSVLGIYTKKRVIKDRQYTLYSKLIEEHLAMSITDTKGIITYVTDAFCTLTGYSAKELVGKSHKTIRHKDMSSTFFKVMWSKLIKNGSWKGKVKNIKKDGGEFIAKTEIISFKNENNETIEYLAIRHDITDREHSNIDPLTELNNRRVYFNKIDKILECCDDISLMYIDIDHFKQINDTYGHNIGDVVLKKFAEILKIEYVIKIFASDGEEKSF